MLIKRREVGVSFDGHPSLTQQQFKDDADINVMVRRFLRGDMSVLSHRSQLAVQDIRNVPESLHDALNIKARADYVWATAPEAVRQSFGTPDRLLQALAEHEANLASNPSASVEAKNSVSSEEPKASQSAEVQPNTNT